MSFDLAEWVDANLVKARPSAGFEWTAECPFCEVFGGFYVNTDPDKRGPFVCFKCKERAPNCLRLISRVEDISMAEARKYVFTAGIEFRRRETTDSLVEKIKAIRGGIDLDEIDFDESSTHIDLPPEFIPVWDGKRWRVPKYMTERKFKRSILREWGVGYCARGFWAGRVIIPLRCPNGQSFTGRDLTGESDWNEDCPKYRNPRGIDHAQLLFGWDHCPVGGDFVIVEGPLDSMKMCQHEIPAMGMGGKTLSSSQLGMLFKRPVDVAVTVMLDPEATPEAYDVASQLIVHFKRIFVAKLPESRDPGNSSRKLAHRVLMDAEPFNGGRTGKVLALISASRAKLQERYS